MTLMHLADILHSEGCSCVIFSHGELIKCHRRGVADLFYMLHDRPDILKGSLIADKVIGKGAAALMLLGRAAGIYADVISQPALDLFESYGMKVSSAMCVPNIINRSGTGICPVESLCLEASTAGECLPLIAGFVNETKTQRQNND